MPRDPVTRALRPLTNAEALDRHLQLVQYDGLGLQLNREQDRLVFHYTNIAGLRGILESRALWASDHRFLNDVSELVFGLQILEMVLASAHGGLTVEVPPDLRADALMGVAMLIERRLDAYVLSTSFCRRGNLLSQWRAYGGRDGVALAFDRAFLEGRARAQGFATGDIHYYFAEGGRNGSSLTEWLSARFGLLRAQVDALEGAVRDELAGSELDLLDNLVRGRRVRAIDRWLLETAAFVKHPAFSEEAEWRCVVVTERSAANKSIVGDRISGTKVVPYTTLCLGEPGERALGISRVVVGPNADAVAIQHAIAHLFSARGLDCHSILTPYTPLRL